MRPTGLKTNQGFLLVEAIISITILLMIAATSISLLVMGHRAINVNKHSLEASWIAQETAESLRGLRDTNWIRYGYDKENCWNSTSSEECIKDSPDFLEGEIGTPANFSMSTYLTGAPELRKEKDPIIPEKGPDLEENMKFLLYYQDLDPSIDYDGDGEYKNDKQYIGSLNAAYKQVEPTKYYRQIQTYEVAPGYFEGLVTVVWYEGSTPHQINLPVTLTNYQLEE